VDGLRSAHSGAFWPRNWRADEKRIGYDHSHEHPNSLLIASTWTVDGEKVIEHLAGVDNFKVAMATYKATYDLLAWPAITRAGCPDDRNADTPEQETLV
jgi:hypothetical protein